MTVLGDNYIIEVLTGKKGAAEVFVRLGAHCLSCSNNRSKTVANLAEKHNADLKALLAELNLLADA